MRESLIVPCIDNPCWTLLSWPPERIGRKPIEWTGMMCEMRSLCKGIVRHFKADTG